MANQILASVAGKVITSDDVDAFIEGMGQRGASLKNNPQGRAMVLDQLIAQRLLLQDAAVNVFEREPAFKAQLAQAKEQLLLQYAVEKVVSKVKVSDDDCRKFFDENQEQFASSMTFAASHILVDTAEKAAEIKAKIDAGEISFADAAKEYSSCPSSAQGGDLGEFGEGQMVPEFENACKAMEEGQISDPVQTQFGFHLIELHKKGESGPASFDEMKEDIRRKLLNDKQQAAYQSKINQLKILYPVDKTIG